MKLLIDIGNSRIKWACTDGEDLFATGARVWSPDSLDYLCEENWAELAGLDSVWVVNVAGPEPASRLDAWFETAHAIRPRYAAAAASACGVVNSYREPARLGADRFMALVGAWEMWQGAACIVDCGTAITADGLSAEGVYVGGVITPGLALMQRSLAAHTHALAMSTSRSVEICSLTTDDGIAAGCHYAAAGFIDRIHAEFQRRLGTDMHCVLTGGEASRIRPLLSVPHEVDSLLVLRGLAVYSAAADGTTGS